MWARCNNVRPLEVCSATILKTFSCGRTEHHSALSSILPGVYETPGLCHKQHVSHSLSVCFGKVFPEEISAFPMEMHLRNIIPVKDIQCFLANLCRKKKSTILVLMAILVIAYMINNAILQIRVVLRI